MSQVKVSRPHTLGVEGARAKVQQFEDKLKQKFGVSLAWRGNQATVKGKGVSGDARIEPDRVEVSLKLGLLARPFAGKIKEAIERSLDKELA